MDIQRELQAKPIWIKYWYLLPIALLMGGAIYIRSVLGQSSFMIGKDEIQIAKVEQGEFKIEVRAIGVLKPQDIRWISTEVAGRVEQILVKPGAQVIKGEALIKLSNPELHRELEKSRWEAEATKAEMLASRVLLESQLVDLESNVDQAEFNYKSAKLRLDAEAELIKQGGGSISKLDFKRTQLSVEQQFNIWQAQKKRALKMQENINASQLAQQARAELVENNYQRIQQQVDALTVKSSMSGIIQETSLTLGQQINLGESVAIIASPDKLFAELQVQELQIKDIKIGQNVRVDTRSSEILGRVSRIDPKVNTGMVKIDIELEGELPNEARPDLNVEGRIITSQIDHALFVKRPTFSPKNSQVKLFLLSADENFAFRKEVELGLSSVTHIQILSGLNSGDSIITSDISLYQQHQQILLN